MSPISTSGGYHIRCPACGEHMIREKVEECCLQEESEKHINAC